MTELFNGGAKNSSHSRGMSDLAISFSTLFCFEIAIFCLGFVGRFAEVSGNCGVFLIWLVGVIFVVFIMIGFQLVLRGYPGSLMSYSAVAAMFRKFPRITKKLFVLFCVMFAGGFILSDLLDVWLKSNFVVGSVFLQFFIL